MKPRKERLATNERINFSTQAAVVWEIGMDGADYVDRITGEQLDNVMRAFSLMKYGHEQSVAEIADYLARAAIEKREFVNFVEKAEAEGRVIFITSPGVMNIPSASNLLLHRTAELINMYLSNTGMPVLIVAERTRIGESNPTYADSGLAARGADRDNRSILPQMFAGNAVVYLDDIYISGSVAENAKARLTKEVGAADVFFLFAARVDPGLVATTDGTIEGKINRYAFDESMRAVIDLVIDGCSPTQKTIRLFFEEKNFEALEEAFDKLRAREILGLYMIACQNKLQQRFGGKCAKSMEKVREYLRLRGLLDDKGLPTINIK